MRKLYPFLSVLFLLFGNISSAQIIQDSCRADFEVSSVSSTPLGKTFTAIPWPNNNRRPEQICWSFGDGRDTCISYNPGEQYNYVVHHLYSQPGLYNVCVKIKYQGGCEAFKCKQVTVGEQESCSADFERIPVTNSTLATSFRALPWHNHEKKPSKICWSFGDGRDTCIQYPENYNGQYTVGHNYATQDSFEVCVKILYYGGCEAHKCKRMIINPPYDSCKVRLVEITPSVNSLTRGFYATPTSSSNRRPERICWYFGDGEDTCIMLTTLNSMFPYYIRHTYPAPGIYRACVKVLFAGGCIASDCKEVVIRSAANICGGYMVDSLVSQLTFKFRGQGIQNTNDAVAEYRWSFGDGSSATGKEVKHTYSHAGNYEVCLGIKTERGCETRICKKLYVPGVNETTLQLSPNPVINELHVMFISNRNETISIKIFNSNGMMVRNYSRNAVIGPNTWNFDVSSLIPGIYSVVVLSPNQLASGIFFKQ